MATTAEYNLGEFTFPRGWFMVATSAEVETKPYAVRYFGEDLVIYRGESGKPYVVEAYCPHMGAHLARNTTSYIVRDGEQIQGESIRCPFHGWRYGPDGRCDHIPYSSFVPKAAKLRSFETVERAGTIWVWYDPEGREPAWPLPDFGGHWDAPGWVRWKIDHMGDLDVHPIEIVDNMADFGHFVPIHGALNFAYFANEFNDHTVHQLYESGHRTLTADPNDKLELDTWYTGPSILQSEMEGAFDSFILIAHTPIDDGLTRVWHALMVQVNDGSSPITDELREAAGAYQQGSREALAQDVEIWQNKRACINPLAIPADGPYAKLRLWYRQFYNPLEKAGEVQARVNGLYVTLDKRQTPEVA